MLKVEYDGDGACTVECESESTRDAELQACVACMAIYNGIVVEHGSKLSAPQFFAMVTAITEQATKEGAIQAVKVNAGAMKHMADMLKRRRDGQQ